MFVLCYSVALTFKSVDQTMQLLPLFGKLLKSTFMWCCLFYDTVVIIVKYVGHSSQRDDSF